MREIIDDDKADMVAYAQEHARVVTEAWSIQNKTLQEQLSNEQKHVEAVKIQAQAFADDLKAETEETGRMTNEALRLLHDRIVALQTSDEGLREEIKRLQAEGVE